MEIGDWPSSRDLSKLYKEIRALGLETNLAELEAFGFSVFRDALSPELTRQLRDAVLCSAEKNFRRKLDLERETELHDVKLAPYLLFTNSVFEQALLNPGPLALISYLLGYSCLLSSLTSHVKGPGEVGLLLHSDTSNGVPAPFSPYSHVANCNYALTDYSEAGGSLAMVPASHRYFRQPTRFEVALSGQDRNPDAIAIEVPAGTAIVWHGNTWHGSFPRQIPGLRLNLSMYFCRQYMDPQEDYRRNVPSDVLERHGKASRLATLLGVRTYHGWREEGPRISPRDSPAGRTWHA
jgi:hypothetical protein